MREVFTREDDGTSYFIEVNLEAGEYKKENSFLFSVFIKYDGIDDKSDSYEDFLETKESLIIAIEYEDKAHYLGSRVVDGWSEFYFCASTARELNPKLKIISPSKNLILAKDPRIPDDAEYFTFEISKLNDLEKVEWYLNDKLVATTKSLKLEWQVERGVYRLHVKVFANKRVRSIDKVLFRVK